jgi:hypothetical protein
VLRCQCWAKAAADNSRFTRGGDASSTAETVQTIGKQVERLNKWTTCTLSGQPLVQPIAADYLGRLYNQEAVIEFLLARKSVFVDADSAHRYINQQRASGFGNEHLKSLKDVFTVHLAGAKSLVPDAPSREAGSTAAP